MRLFLIDGSALAYRSHFAFSANPLTNRKGMQTSAVYGFTTALLRLIDKEKPDLLAVVFDGPERTFRHERYPDYKATREKMPDEMADQLPYIRKIVEAMKIPYLVEPGYEADDIIGTLAVQADKKKMEAFLVTGDKDFMQLLSPRVKMYATKKGGEAEIIGIEAPELKWNVPVNHVVDLLALMGDSSDNVPGVHGVGEKTAAKLIHQFGTIENLYKHLPDVTPLRLREMLTNHKEEAFLSKELVTIHTELPLPLSPEELKQGAPDYVRLQELYSELDFTSLLNSISSMTSTRTDLKKEQYHMIRSEKELDSLIDKLKRAQSFAVDTETTSLHFVDALPIGISLSVKASEAFYVPLRTPHLSESTALAKLKPIFEDPSIFKGGQNVKYDRAVFQNVEIDLAGIAYDTMIESYLLSPDSRQHGIDALAREHLGIEKIRTTELIGKGKDQISMLDVDLEKISHYACEDVDMTVRLHELFAPQIAHHELENLYQNVELPLISVLGDMEKRGIAVDATKLKALSIQVSKRLGDLTHEIHSLAGGEFNINSPKQLGPILYEKLRIQDQVKGKRVKKTKTGYSTDQDTLEEYSDHPVVAHLLEFRNLSKLLSTYIESLPELIHPKTKRIHTSFNQTVAATGRLSSSDPNLQNIPIRTDLGKEIRKAFVPGEPGWKLLSADYSQIELRILAHLSEDATLIDTFNKNEDIHRRTASVIFGIPLNEVSSELRSRAKAINFGVIYGMGAQRLSHETGISMAKAKEFIEAYFEKYAAVRRYLDRQVEMAREKGFVTTILGRRRLISEINSTNPRLSSNAERIATNTPIQGSAADLIKVAMVNIHREIAKRKLKSRMLLQVHDELVFEVHPNETELMKKMVKDGMEKAIALSVPVAVEMGLGDNWAEAH